MQSGGRMPCSVFYLVCVVWCCYSTWAFPGYDLDLRLNRTRRGAWCKENLEYSSGDICCLNCPAGTHLKSPCTRAGDRSECEECPLGTFTEHSNWLKQCLSCTPCRIDQEMVRPCDSAQNIECRCRPGGFCTPDEACEVCRKCAKCGKDEVVVRNCTPTSNTVCKKVLQGPAQTSDLAAVYVTLGLVVPLVVLFLTLLVCCVLRRRRKATDPGGNEPDLTLGYKGTEKSNGPTPPCWTLVRPPSLLVNLEEQRRLCEASGSTTSSAANLISPPFCDLPAPVLPSCTSVLTLQNSRKDEPHFNIVPVNGEVSLRSCFEFFEELDVNYHSRFFRHLGLPDNLIKSKDSLPYSDRVHDLLNFWLEKRGREASLKDLLKSLMDLNQRRTAEIVAEQAVVAGYYYVQE